MSHVDMEPSRRLAYAFVEPPCADPRLFIRRALEQRGGDPPVRLAPVSYGTMMLVFRHPYFREMTVRHGPISLDGHTLQLERHEEAEFRIVYPYTRRVELAASCFPPEHWSEDGIREVFRVYGETCCVARSSLRLVDEDDGVGIADYSIVRVLVLVNDSAKIKPKLVVRNPRGEIAGVANVRVVGEWPHPPGTRAAGGPRVRGRVDRQLF